VALAATLGFIVAACQGVLGSKKPGSGSASGSGDMTANAGGSTGAGAGAGIGAGAGAGLGSSGSSSGGDSYGGAGGAGSVPPDPVVPFEAVTASSAVRKVKNLLTGLPPTDAEVQAVAAATTSDAQVAAFKTLIDGWVSADEAQLKDKMVTFFRNAFQQTGFVPTQDFKPQLLENAGFDFGPGGAYGDDAFPRLVQNLQDSFALTAWDIVKAGQPFTNVLTTQTYEMTTALKSLYLEIEMPNDQPYSSGTKLTWKIDESGSPIALTDTLDPMNANYMVFDDQPSTTNATTGFFTNCRGMAGLVNTYGGSGSFQNGEISGGYSMLFQRLLGFTPRHWFVANPTCGEHTSLPYFQTSDLTDWTPVTISAKAASAAYVQPFDLPTLRTATTLALTLPRFGYYTTPAFMALWNTNDSNQHRVTANQTLLVAWNVSFTSANDVTPVSTAGLAADHAVAGTECYGCHKSLDPLRQFWANQFDYNDRNDYGTGAAFGAPKQTRPTTKGGTLAFGSVNASGASMADLGGLLASAVDSNGDPVNRFAISFAQKLCYYADSASCSEDDPEFRRVAKAFQDANFDFKTLIRELMSSPLVTSLATTKTFQDRNVVVSITRRDQMCQALSNRLAMPDLCAQAHPFGFTFSNSFSTDPLRAAYQIAGSLPADGFGRGSEVPVASSVPTLFFRAASEMLCENVAAKVVAATDTRYLTSDPTSAIADMVVTVMGYPAADPHHDQSVQILTDHYNAALGTGTSAASKLNALQSTFSLACQSPSSLAFGI
jgi:hypothetical protein